MWFKLENQGLEYTKNAPFSFKNEIIINATPNKVFDVLAGDTWKHWFKDFVGVKWTSQGPYGIGSTRIVDLKPLSVKEKFLAWEYGKRYSFLIYEITLPLVKSMLEDMQLEETEDGKTLFRWNVYYTPSLIMLIIHPIARAIFGGMFKQSLNNLANYVQKDT